MEYGSPDFLKQDVAVSRFGRHNFMHIRSRLKVINSKIIRMEYSRTCPDVKAAQYHCDQYLAITTRNLRRLDYQIG